MLRLLVVGIAAALAAGFVQQARDLPVKPSRGTATVSGVVRQDPDDMPSRKARVTLTDPNRVGDGQTTTTDDEGRFTFVRVPPGRFTIQASKGGYLTATHGAARPGRPGVAVAVADGQHVTGLSLKLLRGGAIAGTVYDARGRPVPGFTVTAMRLGYNFYGERTLSREVGSADAVTDDRGVYRAWGLRPGEYVVMATPTPGSTEPFSASGSDFEVFGEGKPSTARFSPVFYPGTIDVSQARALTLNAGDERDGIDLSIQQVPTTRIDGVARMPDGRTATRSTATLSPVGESALLLAGSTATRARTTALDADGRFSFPGIAPGSYSVVVKTGAPVAGVVGAAPQLYFAQSDVTAGDREMQLALEMRPGMTVTGRTVFEGAMKPPVQLSGARIFLVPPGSGGNLSAGPVAPITAEGTFTVAGVVPGEYRMVQVSGPSTLEGWWLRKATANGRESLESPVRVTAGEDVEVVLTYTDRDTRIGGSLLPPANAAPPDYFIVLFATDRQYWVPGSRRVRTARPSNDGVYLMPGLFPGEYFLAALTDLDTEDLNSAKFLETLTAQAIRLIVAEGQQVRQDLRIGK